jgi:Zn-dependent protease with chaperone function
MRRKFAGRLIVLLLVAAVSGLAQLKQFKPGFNLFSPEQDIQLGKEAAAEVQKTMPVINNPELTGYVNRVASRLTKSKRAGQFPYTFQVINDPSINAFALPGGPMFIHTGLLAALDNESQLAGVMAHEMSHVALRHGTNQVSKANLIQLPLMLAAGVLGDSQSIWGSLAQLGIGLGAQSVLLKYSRDAERDADLNGAQIMNDAGYNPTQMAAFFQKLEAQGGSDNSRLANFLSDHPTPGNRVKYVEDQNRYLPRVQYTENEPQNLPRIKQIVAGLPAPPKQTSRQGAVGGSGQGTSPSLPESRPSGQYREYQGRDFSLRHPDNWEVFGDRNSGAITVAPRSALVADSQGQTQIGFGFMAATYIPENGQAANLKRDTTNLLRQIQAGNPNMRQSGQQRNVRVAGQPALVTSLESPSPFGNQREVDMLVTIARRNGLFYMVFIAPDSEWSNAQKTFDEVVRSLRLAN